ncbi:hypothetical protein EAM_3232 [Erwinia amylovora ATCC 49946]|nr:hypothetical protein EAM_3232 [Erwinia amylovora ATCC 49946]
MLIIRHWLPRSRPGTTEHRIYNVGGRVQPEFKWINQLRLPGCEGLRQVAIH